jgi:hypothetical protein
MMKKEKETTFQDLEAPEKIVLMYLVWETSIGLYCPIEGVIVALRKDLTTTLMVLAQLKAKSLIGLVNGFYEPTALGVEIIESI